MSPHIYALRDSVKAIGPALPQVVIFVLFFFGFLYGTPWREAPTIAIVILSVLLALMLTMVTALIQLAAVAACKNGYDFYKDRIAYYKKGKEE